MTTQCLAECLKRGVNIIFYSTYGAYYGRLISTTHVNVQRQRKQADLGKMKSLSLLFKKIIDAKIRNQVVILRRYARSSHADVGRAVDEMQYMCKKYRMQEVLNSLWGMRELLPENISGIRTAYRTGICI